LDAEADRESYVHAIAFPGFQMSIPHLEGTKSGLMFRVSAMRELRAFAFEWAQPLIQPDMRGKREAQ
jgi:hypothetical protein